MTPIINRKGIRVPKVEPKVVICEIVQTPSCPMGVPVNAVDLGVAAVNELLLRGRKGGYLTDLNIFDALINGEVLRTPFTSGSAKFIARGARLYDSTVPEDVSQACASSLAAAELGYHLIASGEKRVIIVTGIEAMQRTPFLLEADERDSKLNSQMRKWAAGEGLIGKVLGKTFQLFGYGKHYGPGLSIGPRFLESGLSTSQNFLDPYAGNMVATAHPLGNLVGSTRQSGDHIAFESHARASSAKGRAMHALNKVRYFVPGVGFIEEDGNVRPIKDDSMAKIAAMKGLPGAGGLITAANASNMGALGVALLMMDEQTAIELGAPILCEVLGFGTAGVDGKIMGSGPVPAVDLVLSRFGLLDADGRIANPERFGHWEVNEAFATVVDAFQRYWKIDPAIVNPYGGGIAMGHPLGATGARILGLLARAMSLGDYELAVFALCMAGGIGKAVLIRRYVNENAARVTGKKAA
jgi:acetyl-CoA C-acetyltransferase